MSVNVDPATNRLLGYGYDANGNMLTQPGMGYGQQYGYDAENRMTTAPGVRYGYDGQNKRNYIATPCSNGTVCSETVAFYGIDGQKMGIWDVVMSGNGGSGTLRFAQATGSPFYYFGRRRLQPQDRISSVGKYYPYGEDRNISPPLDTWRFASYWRDSITGLDYADQRYYSSGLGRFMSSDPSIASTGPTDPGSWNRYSYSRGDSINRYDPTGLQDTEPPVQIPLPPYDQRRVTVFGSADFIQLLLSLLGGAGGDGGNGFGGQANPWDEVGKKQYLKDKNDQRDRNGIECHDDIIAAMRASWAKSANGKNGTEAGFVLVGNPQNYTIQEIPFTNEWSQIHFALPAGAFAIVHVHPDGRSPTPSEGDINAAKAHGLRIYAESSSGLWEYDSSNKTQVGLAVGLRWTKPCD